MLPQFSEKELQERTARELEDSKRKLDKTAPGGVYISAGGFYQNADGQHVDENGKYVNEPIAAEDVQQRMAEEKDERVRLEAEAQLQVATRRAEADRIAAEQAKAQADRAKAEADLAAKAERAQVKEQEAPERAPRKGTS